MTDEIVVNVTIEDAAKAKWYTEPNGCLLATALRRMFPTYLFGVGPSDVFINDEQDEFLGWWQMTAEDADRIRFAYDRRTGEVRSDFEPFTVTLTQNKRRAI